MRYVKLEKEIIELEMADIMITSDGVNDFVNNENIKCSLLDSRREETL